MYQSSTVLRGKSLASFAINASGILEDSGSPKAQTARKSEFNRRRIKGDP